MIPDRFLHTSRRARERAKESIRRDAERRRAEMFVPSASFGRRPGVLVGAVVVLLCLGAGLVNRAGRYQRQRPENHLRRMDTAQRNVDKLRIAIERFRRDCGRYPSNEEGLEALVWNRGLPGWKRYVVWVGPDPWGNQYFYHSTNEMAVLFSFGPDGHAGTPDDIASQDPDPGDVNRDQILGRMVSTETTWDAGATSVVSETDTMAERDEDESSVIPVTVLPSKREGK